jgi:thiamine phosphate synthase YjbQ (UPF0047 family)
MAFQAFQMGRKQETEEEKHLCSSCKHYSACIFFNDMADKYGEHDILTFCQRYIEQPLR